MANNRMYLRCAHCPDSEHVYIAKYYPSTGYYCSQDEHLVVSNLEEFFEKHKHISQWGPHFVTEFEIEPDYERSPLLSE